MLPTAFDISSTSSLKVKTASFFGLKKNGRNYHRTFFHSLANHLFLANYTQSTKCQLILHKSEDYQNRKDRRI